MTRAVAVAAEGFGSGAGRGLLLVGEAGVSCHFAGDCRAEGLDDVVGYRGALGVSQGAGMPSMRMNTLNGFRA